MKIKRIGLLVLLLLVFSIIVCLGIADFLPPRLKYGTIDLESLRWRADFIAEYKKAIVQGDNWAKNPETIALGITGYPNNDSLPPEKVTLETTQDGKVIVTILSRTSMDDSIARQETRVELVKDGEFWRIEWAGLRQQCRRGFGLGWTRPPCP